MTDDSEQRQLRVSKLEALKAAGENPFAVERYDRTHLANDVRAHYDSLQGQSVRIAGRMLQPPRLMGKAAFVELTDDSGKMQIYVRRDDVGSDAYERFKDFDYGDILGAEGEVFTTRTGEISVHVRNLVLLAKCLRPLPVGKQYDGDHTNSLGDIEQRYRMRYVDLLVNPEAREVLVKRSLAVREMRRFLDGRGFLEVETPVLQAVAGGAAARPFMTHHNALDFDFKLRISLELYLKRLTVGGLERVYEIGRVFRNEGVSTRHSPEFSMMELYQAYANLEDIMELVEEFFVAVNCAVNGSTRFDCKLRGAAGEMQTKEIDLGVRPWRRLAMLDGIREYASVEAGELRDIASARAACERVGVPADRENTVGGIIEKLHERFTQPNLIEPTFITDFPVETSPLAKHRQDDPTLARRFEIYIGTQELGNAFSEINDPFDQRARFEDQLGQRAAGDDEAHPMDEDYIRALEYGMPPTGGLGIGVDRMVMLLTGAASIRDVVLFPLLRPER